MRLSTVNYFNYFLVFLIIVISLLFSLLVAFILLKIIRKLAKQEIVTSFLAKLSYYLITIIFIFGLLAALELAIILGVLGREGNFFDLVRNLAAWTGFYLNSILFPPGTDFNSKLIWVKYIFICFELFIEHSILFAKCLILIIFPSSRNTIIFYTQNIRRDDVFKIGMKAYYQYDYVFPNYLLTDPFPAYCSLKIALILFSFLFILFFIYPIIWVIINKLIKRYKTARTLWELDLVEEDTTLN